MSTHAATLAPALSLRANFSWTMVGNLVYAGTQWGILILLARLGSPEAVGEFSLGLAIAAPVMLFAGLQLRSVQATDARHQFEFREYAAMRLVMTVAAAVGIAGVGALWYRGGMALTLMAFAISKGFESLSDVIYGLWQQKERMNWVSQSLMLRGMLGLAAAGSALALFHACWTAVCGMAAAWALVLLAFDLPRAKAAGGGSWRGVWPRFAWPRMRQLAALSLPLGIVTVLISLNASIPRYMISHFRSVRELGIFSALGYTLTAGAMIVGALGQSATPRLAVYAVRDKAEFQRLSSRLLGIGLALGMGGIGAVLLCGRQIVTVIYGPAYASSYALLVWLMVAAAASYLASFAGYSLTAARHFRVQTPLFAFITALTGGLCWLMVRADGSLGAAKALTIAGCVQLGATMIILRLKEQPLGGAK